MEKVRIWDLPVRLFHWALVALFAFSWWSGENHEMEWHRKSGLAILALLLFRLFWGFAGSRTARFAEFLRGPGAVLKYVRTPSGAQGDGHNPLGGWSVLALLATLMTLAATGLFSVDVDGFESGPLASYVSFETGRVAAQIHELTFKGVVALVGLHLCAIAVYHFAMGRNLLGPMITGKRTRGAGDTADDVRWSPVRAMAGMAAVLALVWAVSKGFQFTAMG